MPTPIKTSPAARTQAVAGTSAPAEFFWALGVVVAFFGAVRFACLFNDLWLDEIWSLRLVQRLHSPAEIFTRYLSDNNHPLNSLWLYLLNPAKADWTYRLLSWFTGTAAVWLAGIVARRQFQRLHRGDSSAHADVAGLMTALVIGGSFFLIHYSSEARGYAPAVGFSLLAICALRHGSSRPAGPWAAVYGFACVLGLLSHLVAFQVVLAGLVWSVTILFRRWNNWRDRLVHLAGWHLVPWVFLGVYYLTFVRKVGVGGGPKLGLGNVLGTLSAFSLGMPEKWGAFVALPVFLGFTLVALGMIWRRNRALAGFYATAIFFAPALGVCFSGFLLLYPRYFIVSAAVALLLTGHVLARLWNSGGTARWASVILLGGFLAGNAAHTVRLLRDGRGQYQKALRYIAEQTPSATITVSSDSDFRNFMVMDYYTQALGPKHQLHYFPADQSPPEGLQWIFLHRLDETTPVPPDAVHDAEGHNYQLARVFPHAPLSGFEWYVYRNLDPAVLPPASR